MLAIAMTFALAQDAVQEDPIKAFEKRLECLKDKDWKLLFDKTSILETSGDKMTATVEGEGDNRALVVRIDGKEFSRTPLPKLDVKPGDLPPLSFPKIGAGISTKVENKSVDGKSVASVWVDGKLVYSGPGGNKVQAQARSENGSRFVEVTIDGRVVYRAGQAGAPDKPKDGDIR